MHRLVVGPLDLPSIDRLLRARLQASFTGSTVRRVEETSGGNPFFAIELGRALLDPDAYAVPGQPFPAPASLSDLLSARLARVPPTARNALLAAAALARPTVDLVLDATASDGVDRTALDQAVAAGMITVHGVAVRFTHPLLASVVYAEAPVEHRRRLHLRLAALVADPEEQARHLGLSADAPDAAIATALDGAAKHAAARGAPDTAAVLLEQAADLTPTTDVDDGMRRTLDAADQHIAAGDTEKARSLLDGIAAAWSGTTRARALHRLGRISVLDGDLAPVPVLLQEAEREVGDDLPLRAAIERDLVWALAQVGAAAEAVPHAHAALHAAEASGEPVLIAEVLDHLCMAQMLAGHGIDSEVLDRVMSVDETVGTAPPLAHPGIASGRLPLALTLKWTDHFDRARDLMESLLAEHAEHGDEGALAPVLFHLGELECWAGKWAAAARLAGASHDLASRTRQAVAERRALTLDALIASYQGNADVVYPTGTASLALAERDGDPPAVVRSLKSLGMLDLSLGNAERAAEHFDRALEVEATTGYDPAVVRIVPDAIEALLLVGRVEDAAPLVDDLERRAARSNGPWALATSARCRGLLEAARGRLTEAQAALERAVREHERLPQPFERARTLLALGSVQRRAKQKRVARHSLDDAMRSFDELGATLWSVRTRTELGRIPGRTLSLHALTATEEQVATLVAEGRTNREVALSMFMSVKTVETNLTRIYRKLDIASRRELAQRMRTDDQSGVE